MDRERYRGLFLAEAREHLRAALAALDRAEDGNEPAAALADLMRRAHSLKGMAASLGHARIVEIAHGLETEVGHARREDDLRDDALLLRCADALATIGRAIDELDALPDPRPPSAAPPRAAPPTHDWRLELLLADEASHSARRTADALASLSTLGRVARVDPPRLSLATGCFEGRLSLLLRSGLGPAELDAGLRAIEEIEAHSLEPAARPRRPRPTSPDPTWVRVTAEEIDRALDELQGLRHTHRRIRTLLSSDLARGFADDATRRLKSVSGRLMDMRMVCFGTIEHHLRAAAGDVARRRGKRARCRVRGGDTRVDRDVLEALTDPLVHVVRNAVDHGIEPAVERHRAGKPEVGLVEITVDRSGPRVRVAVRDDGRGIEGQRVRRQAERAGLFPEADATDVPLERILTLPGFSTAGCVDEVSGRGVGLDVARAEVARLGGRLRIVSRPGRGTAVELLVPSRRAVVAAVVVRHAGMLYALPLDRVERVVGADAVRDGDLELLRIDHGSESDPAVRPAVLLRARPRPAAVVVDEILGCRSLVVRPLPPPLEWLERFSGAAMLDDGAVVLVLDPSGLVPDAASQGSSSSRSTSERGAAPTS